MQGENPNKNLHWKNKLDDLGNIPGETFGKEVAWNKLYERLRGKKENKKAIWYWIAAACLLFAFITTLINRYKNNPQPPASATSLGEPKTSASPIFSPEKNDQNETENINITTKNKTINASPHIEQADHRIMTRPMISKMILNDTINSSLITEAATKSLQIPNTSSNATVGPLAKQKLKVVHINELESPVIGSPPDMVRNTDKHSFKFIHPDEEVFAGPPVNTQSHGFIVISKPSSN